MEITFIGHSCFRLKGKQTTLVIDPYYPDKTGYKLPKLSADIVLMSHDHEDHSNLDGVADTKLTIQTPGEYEMSDTFVYGFQTYHDANKGSARGKNTIYQIDMDGFTVLHLGDLGHELSTETLEKISDVDVLLIPVGGTYTIDAKTAVKVISSLEPGIVVPMHYQTKDLTGLSKKLDALKVFLEEMGVEESNVKKTDKLKLSSRVEIPEESEVYVLSPQH